MFELQFAFCGIFLEKNIADTQLLLSWMPAPIPQWEICLVAGTSCRTNLSAIAGEGRKHWSCSVVRSSHSKSKVGHISGTVYFQKNSCYEIERVSVSFFRSRYARCFSALDWYFRFLPLRDNPIFSLSGGYFRTGGLIAFFTRLSNSVASLTETSLNYQHPILWSLIWHKIMCQNLLFSHFP